MDNNFVTKDDLQRMRIEIITELIQIFKPNINKEKKILKSDEVRELLGGISISKLQDMRRNGSLPYSKIGHILFYQYSDIEKILAENRLNDKKVSYGFEKRSNNFSIDE